MDVENSVLDAQAVLECWNVTIGSSSTFIPSFSLWMESLRYLRRRSFPVVRHRRRDSSLNVGRWKLEVERSKFDAVSPMLAASYGKNAERFVKFF